MGYAGFGSFITIDLDLIRSRMSYDLLVLIPNNIFKSYLRVFIVLYFLFVVYVSSDFKITSLPFILKIYPSLVLVQLLTFVYSSSLTINAVCKG